MRILLRDSETGHFFRSATNWTPIAKDAFDFESQDVAISTAQELRLKSVELWLTWDDYRLIYRDPISPRA